MVGRKQFSLEQELENSGLAVFTSGMAGTLPIFLVQVLNAAECQSKTSLGSMEGQQF